MVYIENSVEDFVDRVKKEEYPIETYGAIRLNIDVSPNNSGGFNITASIIARISNSDDVRLVKYYDKVRTDATLPEYPEWHATFLQVLELLDA